MMNFFTSKHYYYRFAQITPIFVYILMMLGSYVKAINARISCPDWPLCYGQIFPGDTSTSFFTYEQIMAEYIHRIFALLVVILIVSMLYFAYLHRNDINKYNENMGIKRLQLMILVNALLALQVIFGALTVLLPENIIVSIHLAVATVIFGGTILHVSWIKHPNIDS